jgi:branched-chain amino acid transport system permease protein
MAACVVGGAAQLALAAAVLIVGLVVPLDRSCQVAYQLLASASVLVPFIIRWPRTDRPGLVFFGGEGLRSRRFPMPFAGVLHHRQSIWVVGASLACMLALWLFFEYTLYGKALRATAINRVGARIVGIPTEFAGRLAFTVAAAMGALSGILIAPLATIYYDTGLMLGLKGFVGAILGGMGSYPLAALGALAVGLLEAFSSFWASNLKETIVFTFIIPVLLWLSLVSRHPVVEDEEE